MYFLAINTIADSADGALLSSTIPRHVSWIAQQIRAGIVIQAGKWGKAGGVTVLRAEDEAAAKQILGADPLVSSGCCELRIERFYPDVQKPSYD